MSFLFLSSWSPYHLSVSLLLLLLLFFFLFSPLLRFPFLLYHPLQTQKDIKTVIWNLYCKSFPLIPLCCHFHSFWCHELFFPPFFSFRHKRSSFKSNWYGHHAWTVFIQSAVLGFYPIQKRN